MSDSDKSVGASEWEYGDWVVEYLELEYCDRCNLPLVSGLRIANGRAIIELCQGCLDKLRTGQATVEDDE